MIYVLDASAMIAWLRNETGADIVDAAVRDVNSQCLAHAINLCEVYYDAIRKGDETRAQEILNDLRAVGIVERNDFDEGFWKDVGKLKAAYRASLADLCAITLTNRVGGTMLTSDHHELDSIAAGVCPISFIR